MKNKLHLVLRANSKLILYFVLAILCFFVGSCSNYSNKVMILTSKYTLQEEIDSLHQILLKKGNQIKIIPTTELTEEKLRNINTLVYHRSDSSNIEEQEIKLKEIIIPFVEKGGNLLLSMESVRLLNSWNIESQPLELEYQDAKNHGYGRQLGFHGYREHPIYEGLFGGAYVWKGITDHEARTLGFSGKNKPKAEKARVLGINWAYIHYHESRKIIWETPIGKGKILAIGAYLYFSKPNTNRSILRIFTENVIDYLNGNRKFESKEKYWVFDELQIQEAEFPNYDISLIEEQPWEPSESKLKGVREANKKNYWNIAGQQVLAMGKEQGNIEEIWIHPIMVLRDLSVGLKYKNKEDIIWLDNQQSTITKCPEYLERIYTLNKGNFKEIITASPKEPLMTINYKWDDIHIEKVYITYTSNLRLMWPYSLNATGTLHYATDKNGAITTVFDKNHELNIMTAFDHEPAECQSGMYNFRRKETTNFTQTPAEHKQVAFLYTFDGKLENLNFYLSGGENGTELSAHLLKNTMGNSKKIYEEAKRYYQNFDKDFLSIESSDSLFNLAYRWALVAVDKFFCHTPSVGKSMMAGYWTTSRGWNGSHKVSGRPGYAWYFGRDTELTGIAMNSYGDHKKVKDILTTFSKYQDPDGKIYHELTTSGSVHYDAADATPLFLVLAGDYLRKSGDIEFIKSQWENIEKALSFCYSTDTDKDGLIENTNVGHGIQEGDKLYGAHTEIYLASIWAQALKECAYMASAIGDKAIESKSLENANLVSQLINKSFWNDSLLFFNHGLMIDGSYQEYKSVFGSLPIIYEISDSLKSYQTASNFSNKYFSTDWGVRTVGYDSPFFGLGGYAYGNIFPFHTGLASMAEYQAGLRFQGFRHAYSSLKLFDTWDYGNIAEVILGNKLSFTGICPHQQWSSSMALRPLYEGMLKIRTDALKNEMSLSPAFPVDWTYAHIKNIRMGNKLLTLDYERTDKQYKYTLKNKDEPINLKYSIVLPIATEVTGVSLNHKDIPYKVVQEVQNIRIDIAPLYINSKMELAVYYKGGIGIMTNLPVLYPDMPDEGIRLESEKFNYKTRIYTLKVAGAKGKSYEIEVFAPSEIIETKGAEIISKKGNHTTFKVDLPNSGKEPFIDHYIEIKLK